MSAMAFDETDVVPAATAACYPYSHATAGEAIDALAAARGTVPHAAGDPATSIRVVASLVLAAQQLEAQAREPYALYHPVQIGTFLRCLALADLTLRKAVTAALAQLAASRERGELGTQSIATLDLLRSRPRPDGRFGFATNLERLNVLAEAIASLEYHGYRDEGAQRQLVAAANELGRRGLHVQRILIDKPGTWPSLEYAYRGLACGLRFNPVDGWESLVPKGNGWTTLPMAAAYTSAVHPRALVAHALRSVDAHLDTPTDPDADRALTALVQALTARGETVLEHAFALHTGDAATEAGAHVDVLVDGQALRVEAVPGWLVAYRDCDGIERCVPLPTSLEHTEDPAALAADVMTVAGQLPEGWRSLAPHGDGKRP